MHYRMTVPASALSPFSEDASQAAAGIGKEATEDKSSQLGPF
jgi:hypothetical protein